METGISLSTDSIIVTLGVVFLITVVPVKLGASFVGAMNNSFVAATIAAAFGLGIGAMVLAIFGGFTGVILAYVAVSVAYWVILKPTLGGAFGLTLVIIILQAAILQGLLTTFGEPFG